MKNYLLVLLILLFPSFVLAQNDMTLSHLEHEKDEVSREVRRNFILEQKIAETKILRVEYNKDGTLQAKSETYIKTSYDAQGRMISEIIYNNHGKIWQQNNREWTKEGWLLKSYYLNTKQKKTWETNYVYNEKGLTTSYVMLWGRNQKYKSHKDITYDEKGNTLSMKYFSKNKPDPYLSYVYSYYENGERKQTIQYNDKGKIIHTWNYECDPKGKIAPEQEKINNLVCTKFEKDKDGNTLKITEEFIPKGRIARTVMTYNDADYLVEANYYKRSGKLKDSYVYEYLDKTKMKSSATYKGEKRKLISKRESKYDESGKISEAIIFYKSIKPLRLLRYEYVLR